MPGKEGAMRKESRSGQLRGEEERQKAVIGEWWG